MKFYYRIVFLCLLCGTVAACSVQKSIPTFHAEPVSYQPPRPQIFTLPNGLTVMFLNDPELPLLNGALFTAGGTLSETAQKSLTLGAMGGQLRAGGAGNLSADELDEELEKLSADVGSEVQAELGKIGFACLEQDIDRVFSLFADVVLRPHFEKSRLDLWKGQALEDIARRKDDPSTIAQITFQQLLYGAQSPYGWVPKGEDVQRVSREEMMTMYDHYVRPDGAILVIAGDIDEPRMRDLVSTHFASWTPRGASLPPLAAIDDTPQAGIYFIRMPLEQATVMMGHLGPQRLSPDYVAIEGLNHLLSNGFSSRLFSKVRSELGLAYMIYGSINPGATKGNAMIAIQTKSISTGQAMSASINELKALQTDVVTDEELSSTQTAKENAFIFKVDTADKVVTRTAMLRLLHYPENFDESFLTGLKNLKVEEIREAARTRWHPNEFVTVVVGNEQALQSIQAQRQDQNSPLFKIPLKEISFNEVPMF